MTMYQYIYIFIRQSVYMPTLIEFCSYVIIYIIYYIHTYLTKPSTFICTSYYENFLYSNLPKLHSSMLDASCHSPVKPFVPSTHIHNTHNTWYLFQFYGISQSTIIHLYYFRIFSFASRRVGSSEIICEHTHAGMIIMCTITHSSFGHICDVIRSHTLLIGRFFYYV